MNLEQKLALASQSCAMKLQNKLKTNKTKPKSKNSEFLDLQSDIKISKRYKVSEAASILNVSKSALEKSRKSGVLFGRKAPDFVQERNGRVFYPHEILMDWLNETDILVA